MGSLRAEGRPHCETISPFSTCSGQSRPQTLFMADSGIVHTYSKKRKCHNSVNGHCDITPADASMWAVVTSLHRYHALTSFLLSLKQDYEAITRLVTSTLWMFNS